MKPTHPHLLADILAALEHCSIVTVAPGVSQSALYRRLRHAGRYDVSVARDPRGGLVVTKRKDKK